MPALLTLCVLAGGLLLTPVVARLMPRATGWFLAAVYIAAAVVFAPAFGSLTGTGAEYTWSMPWIPAWGVELSLRTDPIGALFTLLALVIGAVVLVYAAAYLGPGKHLGFYLGMAMFTLAMVALVTTDDAVVLFLCWELTSLASFLLIARSGRAAEAPSMRTLLITFLGGLTLLAALAIAAVTTGTTRISEILVSQVWAQEPGLTSVVAVLLAVSAMTKSAQFPFHSWLPDAMAAATPVSAYLHAAAVVKAGIFLLLRFSPLFHAVPVWSCLLVAAGLATALIGGLRALQQTDLKKIMAYSTVSQLGLIVAAIGTGTAVGLAAAALHTLAHAVFKSGLFMAVGVIDHTAGTRDLRHMPALRRQAPFALVLTVLGAAAMAGVPPLLGFVSKESVFTAMLDFGVDGAGGTAPAWAGPVALVVAGLASVFTVAYCAKIVVGVFVDGPRQRAPEPLHPHAPSALLLGSTAVPLLASAVLVLALVPVNTLVGSVASAAGGLAEVHDPHLALWHGVNAELITTVLVLALGLGTLAVRRTLWPALEGLRLPATGAGVLEAARTGLERTGAWVMARTAHDHAGPHAAAMLVFLSAVLLGGVGGLIAGGHIPPVAGGVNRPIDAVLLVLLVVAVAAVVRSRTRLGATVSLSAVGILITVQILSLGAPDVALTQLLVESLTVIVIMLVLQRLPKTWGSAVPSRRGRPKSQVVPVIVGVATGLAAFAAVWALNGRRERSDLGTYLLQETYPLTHGHNVVNVILVEFRALDTLGELTVLGMAGVAIVAILSTIRSARLDPATRTLSVVEAGAFDRGEPELGSETARRAIMDPWANTAQLQLMLRVILVIMLGVSALLFWRGHNEPGGGFNAALVGSAVVGLMYLSTSKDRQIGPPRMPLYFIGGGVMLATATGLWNMAATGTYMEPQHVEVLGQHLSTAMVFDAGVYLAVLGLILVSVNVLGVARPSTADSESMRGRLDEAVEGVLPGPMDTVRGERPDEIPATTSSLRVVSPGSQYISTGTRPPEWGHDA
jgi:multicomponent Na+:H+ antiporter subunit A